MFINSKSTLPCAVSSPVYLSAVDGILTCDAWAKVPGPFVGPPTMVKPLLCSTFRCKGFVVVFEMFALLHIGQLILREGTCIKVDDSFLY